MNTLYTNLATSMSHSSSTVILFLLALASCSSIAASAEQKSAFPDSGTCAREAQREYNSGVTARMVNASQIHEDCLVGAIRTQLKNIVEPRFQAQVLENVLSGAETLSAAYSALDRQNLSCWPSCGSMYALTGPAKKIALLNEFLDELTARLSEREQHAGARGD